MTRKKYNVGDFFEMKFDVKGRKGYGKIIGINNRFKVPIIEIYDVDTKKEYNVNELQHITPIKRLMCEDTAFRTGKWKIVGNSYVEPEEFVYWQFHDHFEKYVIIKDGDIDRVIKQEEIKDNWIDYSITTEEMVEYEYSKLVGVKKN